MAGNVFRAAAITLPDTNAHQLSALLNAIDSTLPINCIMFELQVDLDAANPRLYVGDSAVATNKYGVKITGTQAWSPPPLGPQALFDLSKVWLVTDTPGLVIGVSIWA